MILARWLRVAGAAGMVAAGPSAAQPQEVAARIDAVCTVADPALVANHRDADLTDLARSQPAAALAVTCHAFRAEVGRSWAWRVLDVAQALQGAEKSAEALALLASLPAAPSPDETDRALVGEAELLRGVVHLGRGENNLALRQLDAALGVFQAAGLTHTRRYAYALLGRAQAARQLRVADFLASGQRAADIAAKILAALGREVSQDMSDVLNLRTLLAYDRQDLPGAAQWAQAEIDLMRRLGQGDDPELLHSYASLGGLLTQMQRLPEAEVALSEGMRLIDLHPDRVTSGQLGVLQNLATLYDTQGRRALSLATAERALALVQRVHGVGSARSITALITRADSLRSLARYPQAARAFDEARAVASAHASSVGPIRRLRVLWGYAAVQRELGDADAVVAAVQEARSLTGTSPLFSYWVGRIDYLAAAMAADALRWDEAQASYGLAQVRLSPILGDAHPFVLGMLAMRCTAQLRGGFVPDACSELEQRMRSMDDMGTWAPPLYMARGAWAASRGRDDEALDHLLRAVAHAETIGTPYPLWHALAHLAAHLRRTGEGDIAIMVGKRAIEQIERMRLDFDGTAVRSQEAGFLADKLIVYRRLADWMTEDGRIGEALEVLRLLKAEEFDQFMMRAGSLPGDDASARRLLTPREARALATLPPLGDVDAAQAPTGDPPARPPALPASGVSTPSSAEHFGRAVSERLAAWRRLLASPVVARSAPRDDRVPPSFERSADALQVWLYLGVNGVNLVTRRGAAERVQRIEIAPAELARQIGRALAELSQPRGDLVEARRLHAILGEPIEREARRAGVRRIVLQLDGVLRYLPFAALHDGRGFVGERYAIEQRVATRTDAHATPVGRDHMVRLVGLTRSAGGMAPLRALASEVCGIVDGPVLGLDGEEADCLRLGRASGVMPGAAWLNDAFTAERLTLAASEVTQDRRNVLHVGTHFVLRPGFMGRSWLQLGDGRRMSLDEMAKLDFRGQSLVTLSACETGLGGAEAKQSGQGAQATGGAEIEGLNTLVLRLGAGSVVASLWRVEDASTAALMREMYRALARGATPAEALRGAQAKLRSLERGRFAHPFYWAGFYLVSAGR